MMLHRLPTSFLRYRIGRCRHVCCLGSPTDSWMHPARQMVRSLRSSIFSTLMLVGRIS